MKKRLSYSEILKDSKDYPSELKEAFKSLGKEEVETNIWLTKKEYETLKALYGEDLLSEVILNLSDWSTNPNPDKSGHPSYLKFRQYVCHYRLIKNSIKRSLREED